MLPRIWNQKCRKRWIKSQGTRWWEVSWQRLQEPHVIVHATLALQVLPSQSRHMDTASSEG